MIYAECPSFLFHMLLIVVHPFKSGRIYITDSNSLSTSKISFLKKSSKVVLKTKDWTLLNAEYLTHLFPSRYIYAPAITQTTTFSLLCVPLSLFHAFIHTIMYTDTHADSPFFVLNFRLSTTSLTPREPRVRILPFHKEFPQ